MSTSRKHERGNLKREKIDEAIVRLPDHVCLRRMQAFLRSLSPSDDLAPCILIRGEVGGGRREEEAS